MFNCDMFFVVVKNVECEIESMLQL